MIEVCFDWFSVGVNTERESYHDNIVLVLRKFDSVQRNIAGFPLDYIWKAKICGKRNEVDLVGKH